MNPRSQIKGEELYKSEDGFKKALNGVYINIAKEGLYGRQTTMYFTDALARLWKDPSLNTDVLYAINRFDYTHQNVEPLVSSIFLTYYNSIAQLNDLLKNLDERTDVTFRYNNDKLLRGEALGLRAFLHLDVLRMFGPMPQTATDGTLAVPYVTEITNETSKLVSKTWGEVFTLMEKDLLDAKALLEEYDPAVTATMRQLEDTYYIGTEACPRTNGSTSATDASTTTPCSAPSPACITGRATRSRLPPMPVRSSSRRSSPSPPKRPSRRAAPTW